MLVATCIENSKPSREKVCFSTWCQKKSEHKYSNYCITDSVWSGHLARDKTLDKFQDRFYWPRSLTQVIEHLKACDICQMAKSSLENTQPLQPIRANKPFEIVTIEIIGPILPESKSGNKYILVMVCHCTEYINLNFIKTQTTKEVAKHVFNLVCRNSCPKRILKDQG